MAGHVHHPSLYSHQALPQSLPISYEGTDFWVQDLLACIHDPQLSEGTYSTASGPDPSLQSTFFRGHDEGAGISHTDNIGPPPTLLGFEGFRAAQDEIATSSLMERGTRKKPNQSRRTRNERVEASSRSPRQSAGMREMLERPYPCKACGERYAQPQGVNRHYRAKHDPSSCIYCGARWSRRYQYRDHIEKQHPGVDPDLILGKAARSRRKATVIGREQPPAIKHDRRIQAVSLQPPLTLPAPAAAKATHVPSTLSSTGKDAQPVNDVVDHASRLPPARPGGSTTPDRSSRAVTALIPALPPPVGGYYGSPVVFDPIIESSGVMHPYPFCVASYDEVWTNTFNPRSRPHTLTPAGAGLGSYWSY